MTLTFGWQDIQKRYGKLPGAFLITFGIFYLVSHALSGERGMYTLLKEERKLEKLHTQLHDVMAQRLALEHRTQLLNSGSLDLDLLDEQSREWLGVAGDGEMVIPLEDAAKEKTK